MAINVEHQTGPGPVVAAAFAGGQGKVRSRAALAGAASMAATERLKLTLKAGDKKREDDFKRGIVRQRTAAGFQQEAAVAAQGRRREDLEFGLTTRTKFKLNQLAEQEAAAMADPSLTPEEKEQVKKGFARNRAGLGPVEKPREQTPREKFDAGTYTDPKTGNVYPIKPDGSFGEPIHTPDRTTTADRIKAVQAATAAATAGGGWNQAAYDKVWGNIGIDAGGGSAPVTGFGAGQVDPRFARQAQGGIGIDPGIVRGTPAAPDPGIGGGQPAPELTVGDPASVAFDPNAPGDATQLYLAGRAAGPQVSTAQQIAAITDPPAGQGISSDYLDLDDVNDIPNAIHQAKLAKEGVDRLERELAEAQAAKGPFTTRNAAVREVNRNLGRARERAEEVKKRKADLETNLRRLEGTQFLERKEAEERAEVEQANEVLSRGRAVGPQAQPASAQQQGATTAAVEQFDEDVDPDEERRARAALGAAFSRRDLEAGGLDTLLRGETGHPGLSPDVLLGAMRERAMNIRDIPGNERTEEEQKELIRMRKRIKALEKGIGIQPLDKRLSTGRLVVEPAEGALVRGAGAEQTPAELEESLRKFRTSQIAPRRKRKRKKGR